VLILQYRSDIETSILGIIYSFCWVCIMANSHLRRRRDPTQLLSWVASAS